MRSENGTFFMFWVAVCLFFLPLFHPSYVKGEGNICKLKKTGKCTNAIVMIDKKSAEEETSFNVYIYQQGKKELVAVLSYENKNNGYICRHTKSYTCTNRTDDTFNVNLGCEPLQNVTLVGDGKQPMRCQPMETKSDPAAESTNNTKHTNCDCRHTPGHSVDGSREKQCPCPNASPDNPDVNPNIRKEDGNGGEVDNLKKNGSLVIIIVMSLIATSAAFVVVVVIYRKLIVRRRKKNRNEHIDKEYAYTEAPLNSESTRC